MINLRVCRKAVWGRRSKAVWGPKRYVALLIQIAVLGLAGPHSAIAQDLPHHAKFDPAVEAAVHLNQPTRVIVQFADAGARENGRHIAGGYGASVTRDLNSLTALSISGPASAIDGTQSPITRYFSEIAEKKNHRT